MEFSSLARFATVAAVFACLTTMSVVGAQREAYDVSLNVTVSDTASKYLTDLSADDFSVFEDGVKQAAISVSRPMDIPIAFTLLLDASSSTDRRFATARNIAIGFARRLKPQDVAEVIGFTSRVVRLQTFTNDAAQVERAVGNASGGKGSTSLWNALFITLKELQKVTASNTSTAQRHVIIVLSDGEDTSSRVLFKEVLELTKHSQPLIYAIGSSSRDRSRGQPELRQLAEATGGRQFIPGGWGDVGDVAKLCDQVVADLSNQYTIGYVSSDSRRDGRWRKVEVRVNLPKTSVRTRPGYFAPGTQ